MSEDLGFRFTWYGHATVHVESAAGTSILIDPWFGHPLSPVGAEAIERCDVMLVIGTSATVQPAATMPVIAKQAGATVIEFNEEETPLTGWISDYRIPGKAGEILERVVKRVEALRG